MDITTSFIVCNILAFNTFAVTTEPSFSQPHFVVWFDPYVSLSDMVVLTNYDVNGIIPMISKVSTRFNRVMGFPIPEGNKITYNPVVIPLAVATFNKLHRKAKQHPMELLMTCFPIKNSIYAGFDRVKEIADEANAIYPGTVKRIIMLYNKAFQNLSEFEIQLASAKKVVSTTEYILGADLFLEDCESFKNEEIFNSILPHINEVYLAWNPGETAVNLGPELAASTFSNLFTRCVVKVKSFSENISVGFRTEWPSSANENDTQNSYNLVTYWKKMNELAEQLNTTAVLLEAFDVPLRPERKKREGWWRLDQNVSYLNSSQFVFQEKIDVAREESNPNVISSKAIILAVISVICFIVMWIALVRGYKLARENPDEKPLTKEEIVEFYKGAVEAVVEGNALPEIRREAYNSQLELLKDSFTIDFTATLGSGTFGAVYRGTVRQRKIENEVLVAVKTSKPNCPNTAIKGLLSEIKVLSYVGKHENIVGLFGAYTKGLKKGKVYVFLELCSLGSLQKYLRGIPRKNEAVEYDELPNYEQIQSVNADYRKLQRYSNAPDLYRWACEIVNGMDFLASKKVVHADLATRNILLTLDRRAKISDFGLSRRLYEYTNYVKTQQEPLPWRWMAPEALRRMEFNEKTDVWSFGVTLWEIYSLGDLPYQGISWSSNFSSQLAKGLLLEEPICNNNQMYSKMLRCWNIDPSKRPTFSELKLAME